MRKIILTEKAPKAIGPYSQAVMAHNMLFLSGQVPVNPETGKLVAPNIKDQTMQVISNIKSILDAAGYSLSDVVKTTVFLTDLVNFQQMNEIYSEYFCCEPPARSTIQVAALPMGAMIEIEVVAMK